MMLARSNRFVFALVCLLVALSFRGAAAHAQDTKENAEFKLAVALYNDGMFELALDQFSNFIRAYPGTASSIEAEYYLGLTQLKLKRYDEARVTFQNFALGHPASQKAPEAWMRVGDAYAAQKNDREAASAYERVKVFHPNSPLAAEALVKAAVYYRKAGALDNARKALRTIIQDYTSSAKVAEARVAMGEIYFEEGRTDLAETEFSRVIESSADASTKARATLLMGKLYLAVGRTTEAQTVLGRVTTQYKTTSAAIDAAFELGRLQQLSGNYVQAIDQLKKVWTDSSAGDETRAQALAALGDCYLELLDYTNALRNYEKFLAAYPSHKRVDEVQLAAGLSAARSGNYEVAFSHFAKVGPTDENGPYARRALIATAEAAAKSRDFARAVSAYHSYTDRFASDIYVPEVLMRLGKLYEEELRDPRRAAGSYEEITQRYPQSTQIDDALFGFGRCKEAAGDIDGALQSYSELVDKYSSSEYFEKVEERIRYLHNHKAKNREEGVEKLAMLVGEMLTEKSRAVLSLKLGDIYFNVLKDYRSAAQQFGAAIDGGLGEDQFAEAYFLRARSYHLLSEIDTGAVDDAVKYYGAFLKQFPARKRSDEAEFYLLQLKSEGRSDAEIAALASDYLSLRPVSAYRDQVSLLLAESLARQGKRREAIAALGQITRGMPSSPFLQRAWMQMGKLYSQLDTPDSAGLAWQSALDAVPRGRYAAEALWLLASLKLQRQPSDAAKLLRRITSECYYCEFRNRAEASLGEAYLGSGDYGNAIELYESLWRRQTQSPFDVKPDMVLVFNLATAHRLKGDRQKAIELYNAYLLKDRTSKSAADAYLALGTLARDQGNTEAASAYFKQAADITGEEKSSREIADLLFQTEQYTEAAKHYSSLARTAQGDDDKRYFPSRLIICKLRTNELKAAQPLMNDFAKTYKGSEEQLAEIEYEKGLYFYRSQDYNTAKKVFGDVADDYDKTRFAAWAEYYLGKILEVTNKQQDAVKKYESILKRFPRSDVLPRVYLSLGNVSYNAEKYQDAITNYQKIVESPETTGEILAYAMNNLITAYQSVELYEAALKVTRDFIDRFPNDQSILDKKINIGVLYTRLGYYDQAALHLQRLLDEAPSDAEAEIRYDIGEAHYSKGDYTQAILEFLKVPYLVTKRGKLDWTATSLYMAGQAYEKMSKFDQAIAMYQQIIDRPGIDATFKAGAKKEIDRVKTVMKKDSR